MYYALICQPENVNTQHGIPEKKIKKCHKTILRLNLNKLRCFYAFK